MELFKYSSYDEYVRFQTEGNKLKLTSHSGVGPEVIAEIKKRIPFVSHILCHGTRAGWEQKHFKNTYGDSTFVVGTEISDTATRFPYTLQWDFSKVKDEWVGKFDIVFSNSFDHSITPEDTMNTWMDQVAPNGSLIMELHLARPGWKPTKTDPLSYVRDDIVDLVDKLGYRIVDEWPSPSFTDHRGRFGKYNHGRPTLRIQK